MLQPDDSQYNNVQQDGGMVPGKEVLLFGGSKGIGEVLKAALAADYEVTDISRSSGYDLLDVPDLPVRTTDFFIYCAGVGYFNEKGRAPDNISEMIRLNLETPIQLTYRIEARHYIYIGSNSSYYGFPDSEVYCAVKHGILGFARALRKRGKKVSVVSPGTVDTDFWANSGRTRPDLYLRPQDVAAAVIGCMQNQGDIEEILITPYR